MTHQAHPIHTQYLALPCECGCKLWNVKLIITHKKQTRVDKLFHGLSLEYANRLVDAMKHPQLFPLVEESLDS